MRWVLSLLALCVAAAFAQAVPPKVPGVAKVKQCEFGTIEIGHEKGKTVAWAPGFAPESCFVDQLLSLNPDTIRLIFSPKVPGVYRVILWQVGDKDYATLVIDASEMVPPVVPPKAPDARANPAAATGKIRFGSAGCTATVIGPRRADGRWDVLTASHCVGGMGSRGTLTMKDGRTVGIKVTGFHEKPDLAWCVTEEPVSDLPYANIAQENPKAGTEVWHMGYGVDVPGNREEGTVDGGPDQNGQLNMTLSVSSGDSGSGIFRKDTGELVAVVCCTSRKGFKTVMWGGCATEVIRTRPGTVEWDMSVITKPIGHVIDW